jgi:dihydroflavonol-4-reductase
MKILVTGAAGHVGANLVRALLTEGRPVRAMVHRDERALAGLSLERVPCDITDRRSVDGILQGIDIVYHCAARIAIRKSDERDVRATNIEGTRHLAEASLAAGVKRFVHFSSIHALQSTPEDEPVDETRPLVDHGGQMLYDSSKAEAERIVLGAVKRGLDAVIVNPTAVIGPYDFKPSFMGQFLLLLAGGKIPGLVQGGFNWVDARDAAAGAMAAGEKGRIGERYILGGSWESVSGLARLIGNIMQRKTVKRMIPPFFARLGMPFLALGAALSGRRSLYTHDSLEALSHYRLVDSGKAEAELGFRHRPLAETLRDTMAWFRENGFPPERGRGRV